MRPAAAAALQKRHPIPPTHEAGCSPDTVAPIPMAGLLSEPIKIIQAPRLTLVLYEYGNGHRPDLYRWTHATERDVPHTLLADQDIFEMYSENERDCARIAEAAVAAASK
jgi:hypothetical protein